MEWDLATIAELGTAVGTIVLALATYASVRSANAAARVAERTMLQGMRPMLFPSRLSDEPIKVSFMDQHFLRVPGGQGVVEVTDDAAYLAMSLRNVGRGMAVLDGYDLEVGDLNSSNRPDHTPLADFRHLTRDLYVPPGEVFFWQGAVRDTSDPLYSQLRAAVRDRTPLMIELLYGDEEGVQHAITRYSLLPRDNDQGELVWLAGVGRHWSLDGPSPR